MARFLGSMPPVLRRVALSLWGATFLVVVFVLVPLWAADLNQEQGWPRWRIPGGKAIGAVLFLGGLGLALYCSRLFFRVGKGTPLPMSPPQELVVSGVYRFTRNPIYVAQVAILLSYFSYSGEVALLAYTGVWALLVQGFVVQVEEPGLHSRFGAAYLRYTREVPRWLGIRRRPRDVDRPAGPGRPPPERSNRR